MLAGTPRVPTVITKSRYSACTKGLGAGLVQPLHVMSIEEALIRMAGQIGSVQGTLATLDNRVSDISSSVKEVHRRVDRMGPINGLIRLWKEAKPMAFTLILVVLTIFGISVDTLVSLY